MLLLRQLTQSHLVRYSQRLYAQKATVSKIQSTMKQAHKQQLCYIDPQANITIRADINLSIKAADVHQYPDANALQAELHGSDVKNVTADMKITMDKDQRNVEIVCTKLSEHSDFKCVLAVPIRASLSIESKAATVSIQNMYGDALQVKAEQNIKTKDIRCNSVELSSEKGDINCAGILLAELATVQTNEQGSIRLDKPQGKLLECKTMAGNISTGACYAESSKFTTDTGTLQLQNVHKQTQVIVYKKGDINMTGFHGNLYVRSNGGKLQLQLSELSGESIVMAEEISDAIVNISDTIEEQSYIEVSATEVTLDSALSHLSDGLSLDASFFRMSTERDNVNKLLICTKGALKLGKLSWAESMQLAMAKK